MYRAIRFTLLEGKLGWWQHCSLERRTKPSSPRLPPNFSQMERVRQHLRRKVHAAQQVFEPRVGAQSVESRIRLQINHIRGPLSVAGL
jgi:hypothetical protein